MKEKRIKINISGLDRSSILRAIRSAYRFGYTHIHLYSKNVETPNIKKLDKLPVRDVIRDEASNLLGAKVQVIDTNNYQIIIEYKERVHLYDIVKRCVKKSTEMSEETILLFKGHFYAKSMIEEKHDEITKLVSFGIREANNTKMDLTTSTLLHILGVLDKIADFFRYIARDHTLLQQMMSGTAVKLFQELHECMLQIDKLYNRYNTSTILDISLKRDDMKKRLRESVKTLNARESYLLGYSAGILELLVDLMQSRMALEDKKP